MFDVHNIWLFIISGLILNIIPGPDFIYIAGRSSANGVKAGFIAATGICSGTVVHIMAAAFGLSAILATSATAFMVIKIAGCLYLLYIGFSMLLSKPTISNHTVVPSLNSGVWQIFFQGFLTNALNPKVAFFFLAFVPQFINADSANKTQAFLFLGSIFAINALLLSLIIAWCAAYISKYFHNSSKLTLWIKRSAGSLFIYFGIKLILTKQNQ